MYRYVTYSSATCIYIACIISRSVQQLATLPPCSSAATITFLEALVFLSMEVISIYLFCALCELQMVSYGLKTVCKTPCCLIRTLFCF